MFGSIMLALGQQWIAPTVRNTVALVRACACAGGLIRACACGWTCASACMCLFGRSCVPAIACLRGIWDRLPAATSPLRPAVAWDRLFRKQGPHGDIPLSQLLQRVLKLALPNIFLCAGRATWPAEV